ncbi:MAG TPA: NAD(P)-dependent oxidoreductase [Acidimicrobiales bacterium]|nr:NAD(P)-dependent oxidoreductase [Acidimicrobiales bacterium]
MTDGVALVTGGSGFVGSHLVPALIEAGWEVRSVGRHDRPEWLPAEVDWRIADLADESAELAALVEGISHVFHLAGASSSKSSQEEMERSNVGGTRRLVAASEHAGIKRFLHMSSTSIYGEEVQLPLPVREDVQPQPSRGYGKAKWGAEEAVWKASAHGLPTVILRPVTVYGPGNVKLLASAILDVAIERFGGASEVPVPGESIEQRLLHIDDLVGACLHLAQHEGASGRAFNVVLDHYPTSHELASIIAAEFGVDVVLSDDPDCGPSHEERRRMHAEMGAAGMTDDILLSPERLRLMRKVNINNRLSIEALRSTGFEFKETDLAASIARTIAWYRNNRWVI